jgi:EAL domain-containing protein (putative c-di-GMP-specific phosphodiesterase class I)
VLLQNTELTLATLHRLRELGVKISMDDFGTGYSSLSYLRSFPFDKIKIGRCFISGLGDGDDARAIVQAIAGLAHAGAVRRRLPSGVRLSLPPEGSLSQS